MKEKYTLEKVEKKDYKHALYAPKQPKRSKSLIKYPVFHPLLGLKLSLINVLAMCKEMSTLEY
jgi:hypothetical protein